MGYLFKLQYARRAHFLQGEVRAPNGRSIIHSFFSFITLLVISIFCFLSFLQTTHAQDKGPIKIGDISSYSAAPNATEPARLGWKMAVEEINKSGGIIGRPVEVISLDAKGDPAEAVRLAQELIERDNVDVLMGTVFDHIKLPVSEVARKNQIPFFCSSAGTDKLIWQEGHPYVFRFEATITAAMDALGEEAAKMPARRWATVAPTLEYGLAMVEAFKKALKKRRPDVEFVTEQWYKFDNMNAANSVQALRRAAPEAILSGVLGGDLPKFLRAGRQRGLFEGKDVIAPYYGYPSWLEVTGEETPEGWITNGYPAKQIDSQVHEDFARKYREKFGKPLRGISFAGYATMYSIAAAIEKSGSADPDRIAEAARGMSFDTPLGLVRYRKVDGQSTFGLWIGKTGFIEGKAALVDWHYVDIESYMPSDKHIRKLMKGNGS